MEVDAQRVVIGLTTGAVYGLLVVLLLRGNTLVAEARA